MSNIARRSKSAPHLAISLSAADDSVAGPASASLRKQQSFIFDHTFTPKYHGSSPGTSTLKKEDPFSLGGFFPSLLTAGGGKQWNWLRAEESGGLDDDEESEIDPSMPHTPILPNAGLLIEKEDKMGILRLCELTRIARRGRVLMNSLANKLKPIKTDGIPTKLPLNLMSPYRGDDDVLDSADSLYDTFKSRRLANERFEDASLDFPVGGLFSPVEEEEEQPQGWYGYIQSIFS
jgi:hypothetical protein